MKTKVGLDIGNFITDLTPFRKRELIHRYLEVPYMPWAKEGVSELVEYFGKKNMFVVSVCNPVFEECTRKWFAEKRFFEETGILESNVFFVRKVEEKKDVAQKIGLNIFGDNEHAVMFNLNEVVEHKFLFNPPKLRKDTMKYFFGMGKVIRTNHWQDMVTKMKECN